VRGPAPVLGEHSAELLAEVGLAPDELAATGAVVLGKLPG
jgi:hypothetical protein